MCKTMQIDFILCTQMAYLDYNVYNHDTATGLDELTDALYCKCISLRLRSGTPLPTIYRTDQSWRTLVKSPAQLHVVQGFKKHSHERISELNYFLQVSGGQSILVFILNIIFLYHGSFKNKVCYVMLKVLENIYVNSLKLLSRKACW